MANKSIHNNPQDLVEERFQRLEAHVTDINCNMNLPMEALASNLRPFGDDEGSNLEINWRENKEIDNTQERSHRKNPRKRK
jgi:hypothetical protein